MKILTTVLALKENVSDNVIINTILNWIHAKHISDENLTKIINEAKGQIDFFYKLKNHELQAMHISNKNEFTTALRYEDTSNQATWSTISIIYQKNSKGSSIRVDIEAFAHDLGLKDRHKIAELICAFSKKNVFQRDGLFEIDGNPIILNESNLDYIARIINNQEEVKLPIVYISKPHGRMAGIRSSMLAQSLCGVAHVIIEENPDIALKLDDKIKQKPDNGDVTIYRYKKFKPHFIPDNDSEGLEGKVFVAAATEREKQLDSKFISEQLKFPDWGDVAAHKASLKAVAEYSDSFDNEMKLLNAEVKELKERNSNLEATNEQFNLHWENKSFDSGILEFGELKEFRPKEHHDFVVMILKDYLGKMDPENRPYEVINSILKENRPTDEEKKIIDSLEQVFKEDRFGSREEKILINLGFSVNKDGRHYKFIYKDNPKYTFIVPVTPSDDRSRKNTLSVILKKLGLNKFY